MEQKSRFSSQVDSYNKNECIPRTMRTRQEEEARDNVLQWTGRLSPRDAICNPLCVTARTKLCYYTLHAIVQREITAYQLVSLLRTASHLIAVTWHLPSSASSYIEGDRQTEREREREGGGGERREDVKIIVIDTAHSGRNTFFNAR